MMPSASILNSGNSRNTTWRVTLGADRIHERTSSGESRSWYGLTLLAASRFDRDGSNVVAALIWPLALLVLMLSIIALPPPGHTAAVLLNHLDPLSYLLGSEHRDRGLIAASEWTRAAAVWVIAGLSIAGATRLWTTREA